ncbi:MAG TPA: hypothetical protein VN087_05870 [Verrucomicrobiae bacterium]|jgi:hypothetical protein|nr:hypothetical protein [Verrucomicrobiae bacterium]
MGLERIREEDRNVPDWESTLLIVVFDELLKKFTRTEPDSKSYAIALL